jgi:putative acetyltransferase
VTAPVIRPLLESDLGEALDVWVAAWKATYPVIDFDARRDLMAQRIARLQREGSRAFVAVCGRQIAGWLLIDPGTGYLDQIVSAISWQGRGIAEALLAHARSLCSGGIDLHVNQDNPRAIGFYQRNGFMVTGADKNPFSGAPVHKMSWRAPE